MSDDVVTEVVQVAPRPDDQVEYDNLKAFAADMAAQCVERGYGMVGVIYTTRLEGEPGNQRPRMIMSTMEIGADLLGVDQALAAVSRMRQQNTNEVVVNGIQTEHEA